MNKALTTQEVAIVIAVPSQNPSLLSEDFLKYSGIIPLDWQLARPPVYDERVAQLVFENVFSIALQADRVMFLEAIGEKELTDTAITQVTCKYVEALKLANFHSMFKFLMREYYLNDRMRISTVDIKKLSMRNKGFRLHV